MRESITASIACSKRRHRAATPSFWKERSELPRRVVHPKRKTIGLRVPDHKTALALLAELGEPLLTSTLIIPGDEAPLTEGWEIQDRLEGRLELILDGGHCGTDPTSVIDLTGNTPILVRAGRGSLAPFALD
jgi:tRNA threonylcarbamoyl adenosine modification protein (Sua5/YciO/YrdC/YwlC family)